VETLDPHRKLHKYIDRDDVEWPNLSFFGWEIEPIWTYFIVLFYLFDIFILENFNW